MEFVLKSSDERETRFAGEVISQVQEKITLTGEYFRTIHLAVYAVEGGGFVVEAKFESDHPDEHAFCEVEDVDCFDDVDKFFYVFDVYENLCSVSGFSRSQREECGHRAKRLKKEYDKVLFPFLETVKDIVETRGLPDRHKEPKKSGLWNMFKSSAS